MQVKIGLVAERKALQLFVIPVSEMRRLFTYAFP